MSDDLNVHDAHVSGPIDVTRVDEVRFWCEQLGVSEYALRQAVADVGVSAEQVAVHLGKR